MFARSARRRSSAISWSENRTEIATARFTLADTTWLRSNLERSSVVWYYSASSDSVRDAIPTPPIP